MWTATWALNTLVAMGKSTDRMVHMLGQQWGSQMQTHGMISAVSPPYYRHIMPMDFKNLNEFAMNWDINPEGKSDEEIAAEGLNAMEAWMKEIRGSDEHP